MSSNTEILPDSLIGHELYETDALLTDYLLFHYGSAEEFIPWQHAPSSALFFPIRTTHYAEGKHYERALDLGCAVGRSSFEISRYAKQVIGMDYSHAFIDAANKIKNDGSMAYRRSHDGDNIYTATRPEDSNPERITFKQGDALAIRNDIGKFDLIHASNLVCRLPDPELFLRLLATLTHSGSKVILATPFSWLETYTPKDKQPKGDSWQWLLDQMNEHFLLETYEDEPFMIREHERKYQFVISRVSVWKRK